MRQQINLYQPIFREQRKALSAAGVALGLALIVAGLAGVSVYSQRQVATLEASVQALRDQVSQQEERLARTAEQPQAPGVPLDPEARVKQLAAQVAEREQALKVLQSGAAGQTAGFATRLEALARRHVPGLWLDGIKLSGTSTLMSLQGATTDPDIVPAYLGSLAADAALSGTRFDEFVIERAAARQPAPPADPVAGQPAAPRIVRFSAGSAALLSSNAKDTEP